MKCLVIAAVLVAGAIARPGGHTGYGGVYKNMPIAEDAMKAAEHASKVAVDLFNDESLFNVDEDRKVRKAVYIPTFFTSVQQQPVAVQQLNSQSFPRASRVNHSMLLTDPATEQSTKDIAKISPHIRV